MPAPPKRAAPCSSWCRGLRRRVRPPNVYALPKRAQRIVTSQWLLSSGGDPAVLPVVRLARGSDRGPMAVRPCGERDQGLVQLPGHLGRGVLDLRWDGRVHGTGDQAVALQIAQGKGEHPAADPLDGAFQLGEPYRPLGGRDDDADAPLPADPVEHLADGARLSLYGSLYGLRGAGLHRYIDVPLGHESASFRRPQWSQRMATVTTR